MELLSKLRKFLRDENLDCLLINSTNEFLVEYNSLEENSRYILTGFSGSTGDAVVTSDNVYLFVDGRYHIQADLEVDKNIVKVIKLQTGDTVIGAMENLLPENARLGINSKKNSQKRVENLNKFFDVKLFDFDFVIKNIPPQKDEIVNVDEKFTGRNVHEKLSEVSSFLEENDVLLLTNSEEVSYLFNKRDFSKPYSSKITAKAIIYNDGALLFTREKMKDFEEELNAVKGKIYLDKSSVNAYDFRLAGERAVELKQSPVQKMKSVKTDAELEHYKEAFRKTDLAVSAVRDFIESNDNISEYDIAQKLEEYFIKFGAKSLSFKSIVAKDKNSALAHYSKCSKDEILHEGSLVLIDCGAYYEGGLATDITRVFVKGNPSDLHKKIYTIVLKTFLHSFNFKNPKNGYEIDNLAREIFEKNPVEGFVFNHGLGHGIGVSVHEYPPNLSKNDMAKTALEEGMCFSIEPGLYNENYFGVRLENSCYFKNGKINSFVKMNYEKKLIDFDMLTNQEKEWLGEFEVK